MFDVHDDPVSAVGGAPCGRVWAEEPVAAAAGKSRQSVGRVGSPGLSCGESDDLTDQLRNHIADHHGCTSASPSAPCTQCTPGH